MNTARHPSVGETIPMVSDDATREFRRLSDAQYALALPQLGIVLQVDRLRRTSHELWAELTVECDLAGARTVAGCLSAADFNLSSVRAREERAHHLAARSNARDVDWLGLLEELCQRVVAEDRAGRPVVSLRDLPRPEPDPGLVVCGLPLLAAHPMCLFGDGGSGKSYVGLFVAGELARHGKRVGIFDWELAGEDHRARLEALYGPDMPDVKYLRCDRPLVHQVDHLTRVVVRERLEYVVFDSVAFACDGPPEAAEVAGRYFQALRQLGPIGSLHIAHVAKAKEGGDRSSEQRPFGSTFWHNGARATWFIKQAAADPTHASITVGLFNRKANLGRIHAPLGFTIAFSDERTTITRADLTDDPDLATQLSTPQRVLSVVRRAGSLTREALAEELDDVKPDTLRNTLKRLLQRGTLLEFPSPAGGPARLGVATRETR